MTTAYLSFAVSNEGVYQGRRWSLSDLVDKLLDAGFPEEVTIDEAVFKSLFWSMTQSDSDGVFVNVSRSRIQPALSLDNH